MIFLFSLSLLAIVDSFIVFSRAPSSASRSHFTNLCEKPNDLQQPLRYSDIVNNKISDLSNPITKSLSVALTAALVSLPNKAFAKTGNSKVWEKVTLPTRETLFDVSFDPSKPLHGWLVGSKGTFLETFDGKNVFHTMYNHYQSCNFDSSSLVRW